VSRKKIRNLQLQRALPNIYAIEDGESLPSDYVGTVTTYPDPLLGSSPMAALFSADQAAANGDYSCANLQ
jgi:hypothetical protein